MYQKNQVYKNLLQKQKHIEHLNASGLHSPSSQSRVTSPLSLHFLDPKAANLSGVHASQNSSYRNHYLSRAGGNRFHALLLSVLHNQRRRHVLVRDSESGKNQSKTLERQVRAFEDPSFMFL